MASSRGRSNADRWEKGFAALSKFRAHEGHCCLPGNYVEGNFNLGPWASTQRYRKDLLPLERKRRLDAIGFVWDWIDYRWEQGFTALLKFKRREGHCRVPIFHSEGDHRLGWWISTQRRRRKELSAKRKVKVWVRVRIRARLGTERRNETRCTICRRYRRNSVLVVEKRQAEAQDLIPACNELTLSSSEAHLCAVSCGQTRAAGLRSFAHT